MIREADLPIVFGRLFDAVNSLVGGYNSSRDVKLAIYSQPYLIFKVLRNHLLNGISLTVQLTSNMEFDVEHRRQAYAEIDSETETKRLISLLQGEGEVRFKYENGELMSVEETARSLMQPFFE